MRRKSKKKSQQGMALFMVISAVALLSVLVAELTYSTQMNSRLAYNYVDGLKAYYLAKAAYKISLVRLKAYMQVKDFANKPDNKMIKEALGKGVLEKIWNMPFAYPLPTLPDISLQQANAIKEFNKESALQGSYTAIITSESSKLNLNNLFVKTATPTPQVTTSPGTRTSGTPNPTATPEAVNFRPLLENTVTNLVEQKKNDDQEFADVYRNITGKDVVDAIVAYLIPDSPPSNLPGFRPIKGKGAPLYSLTELHLVPGIDDELYKLLESTFTVYSTPGINVNTMNKRTLISLVPELGAGGKGEAADEVLRVRDDPEVGQPWTKEEDFWKSVTEKGGVRDVDEVKKHLKTGNINLVFEESSFKINISAKVGLATKHLEAYVLLDAKGATTPTGPKDTSKTGTQPGSKVASPPGSDPNNPATSQEVASAKKQAGLHLIYWRML